MPIARRTVAAAAGLVLVAGAAQAACTLDTPRDEVTYEQAQELYECLKEDMRAGYRSGDKKWIDPQVVEAYPDWTAASELPADPGFHNGRFLLTYVNPTGADAYLEFKGEGAEMPPGTIIAKESFSLNDAGEATAGPLFFMEKVEEDVSPETDGWYYYAVAASGAPMAVDVMTACHECHSGFEGSDYLGYPVEEVRVSR